MSEDARAGFLAWEAQHIFVREIVSRNSVEAQRAKLFLDSIGFNLEARGNKIALLASTEMRDALLNAPATIRNVLTAAGFGWNTQNSYRNPDAHPGYNDFNIEALSELSREAVRENWGLHAKQRAVFDLLRFMDGINRTGSISLQGTSQQVFQQAWAAFRGGRDYKNLSVSDANAIDGFRSSFDATPIDVNEDGSSTGDNSQYRYERNKALYDASAGRLSSDERANAKKNLDVANPNGNNSGHASAAGMSIIHDLNLRSTTPVVGIRIAAENMAAKLYYVTNGLIDLSEFADKLKGIFDIIGQHTSGFADKFSDFSKSMTATIAKSTKSMLVGLGGSLVGDVIEFLNAAYVPIKTGFQTGDFTDFWKVVENYGAAVVVSGLLVMGSIALVTTVVGFFAGPEAAAVAAGWAAAGWAAKGLYDAITNGAELLGKITADLSEGFKRIGDDIEKIGQAIDKYAGIINRIIANAMDVDFTAPVFAGSSGGDSLVTKYLVDPLDPKLPASVEGTSKAERFYGKNNAFVDAKGGNDELYVRDVATAQGGAGDDIVAGGQAKVIKQGEAIDEAVRSHESSDAARYKAERAAWIAGGQQGDPPAPAFVDPNAARADKELTLLLDGGTGKDWVLTFGGEKAVTIGGLGRDWIYNSSDGGIIWGDVKDSVVDPLTDQRFVLIDSVDAAGNPTKIKQFIADDKSNGDNIWYAGGTTLMDAQRHDVLKFYGIPLTGGAEDGGLLLNLAGAAFGVPAGQALAASGIGVHPLKSQYFDHILPFLRYHFEVQGDGSYDLVIDNLLDKAVDAIAALFGDSSQSLGALVNAQGGEMRIKDFIPANLHGIFAVSYLGTQQSELNGLGKLNMVFKKANPLASVQTLKISAIENAIAGALSASPLIDAAYTAAAVATRFAKGMAWSQEVDPLVLDLGGDGLETTDITAAAVHFDINGDLFAERTGWLGAREGFLALDRNGNGRIDNGSRSRRAAAANDNECAWRAAALRWIDNVTTRSARPNEYKEVA